ncbi:MAG: xylulokinase [Clostridia bacterium]|nr:xylulokinase [Clostridia bacterium]
MTRYYIGVDLGTSSMKLLLVDCDGNIKNKVSKEYNVYFPAPGYSEQAPEDWWSALCEGIDELLCGFDRSLVCGIGAGGQMHGLVVLDRDDNVIRPAILWNDGRTYAQTDYLNNVIGKEKLLELTGNIAFAGFTAPKILWMKENESEKFSKIDKIMLPKDYINYRLTGVHASDLSDASGMLLLDCKNKCWSKEMLEICGISEEKLPKLFESYDVIGNILPEIAELFGLSKDVKVVAGAGDNAAAAIGTGAVSDGDCNISLGTSGTVFMPCKNFSSAADGAIHAFCHANGEFHLMSCILSAASCNKWFCEEILGTSDYRAEEEKVSTDALGNNHVFFLPYLMGERSPINDTNARGTLVGMRMDTTRADIYQAVLEGVAFVLKENMDIVSAAGVNITHSTLCGGGARSRLWRKILANTLNIPLEIPTTEEGPGYGGAILAMVASGEYENLSECAKKFVKIRETVYPDPDIAARYEEKYQKFKKLYPALKDFFNEA